jgi:hypothetical protein
MENDDQIIQPGGWCAPSETYYDIGVDPDLLRDIMNLAVQRVMPPIPRGGIQYKVPEE